MEKKKTSVQEEREQGMSVALFSIVIVLTALFICVMVLFLTLPKSKDAPSNETVPPVIGEEPTGDAQVKDESKPVFNSNQVAVTLSKNDSTKTLNAELASVYGILVDAETGEILAEKNADTRFNPASMTKIMTLIVACERLSENDLDRKLQLTQDVHDYMTQGGYAGSSTSFIKNDVYLNDFVTVRDALYAIGVSSAADATYLICKEIAGTEANFVALMNEKVREMGLQNTQFDNAIGHESENNYSSVADLAAIMIYALQCDTIQQILSQKSDYACDVYSPDASGAPMLTQYHWYLKSSLFGSRFDAYKEKYGKSFSLNTASFMGGKTGTLGAGTASDPWNYSLVSFATYGGKTYVAVTGEIASGSALLNDAKTLYDTYIK